MNACNSKGSQSIQAIWTKKNNCHPARLWSWHKYFQERNCYLFLLYSRLFLSLHTLMTQGDMMLSFFKSKYEWCTNCRSRVQHFWIWNCKSYWYSKHLHITYIPTSTQTLLHGQLPLLSEFSFCVLIGFTDFFYFVFWYCPRQIPKTMSHTYTVIN